jgi:D-proline reductase (dithiol) PrdB
MGHQVDAYRFIGGATARIVRSWIRREPVRPIPWTRLAKPLSACRVALVSTGAVALRSDRPFDQDGERRNPWWGDPSHRVLPRDATEADVAIYHLHIEAAHARQDLNCLMPLGRLLELEREGTIGRSAASHYSFMGYILKPKTLLEETTPKIINQLRAEEVDAVLLVPA